MTSKMPAMPIPAVEILEWKENASPRLRFNAHLCELVAPAGLYTADQMRAMWLAGLSAAKGAVPDARPAEASHDRWVMKESFNECRTRTLATLTALEQEAQK